jgi:hypothetical protein
MKMTAKERKIFQKFGKMGAEVAAKNMTPEQKAERARKAGLASAAARRKK